VVKRVFTDQALVPCFIDGDQTPDAVAADLAAAVASVVGAQA